MDSEVLLSLLDTAIAEKEKARSNYETYIEGMNNKTLHKLVQGVLQREEGHLQFLSSFRDSIGQQGDLNATILSAEELLQNSSANEQQMDLIKMIMQEAENSSENNFAVENQNDNEELVQDPDPEQDFIAEPVLRTTEPYRPEIRYARKGISQSRTIVSCRLNSQRTASKKKR